MSIPEELQAWFDLQRETLARVHASWLPGVPAELLAVARMNGLGRRLLAKRLCTQSPALFGLSVQSATGDHSGLLRAGWLTPLLRDSLECALDLGSLVLAATIRATVSRSAVVTLRATLGSDRYRRVLTATPTASQTQMPVTRAAAGDSDVVERLVRCGAAELAAFAGTLHPAWGESVRLTFERGWWQGAPAPRLVPDAAEAALRSREKAPEKAPEKAAEKTSEKAS